MAWNGIDDAEVSVNAPIDETLMKGKIKNNDDDHEARLIQIESQLGGTTAEVNIEELYAPLESDPRFVSNEPFKLPEKRFHVHSNFTRNTPDLSFGTMELADVEANDPEFMTFFLADPTHSFDAVASDDLYYKGTTGVINKDESISFIIKEPYNYFSIGIGRLFTDMCDNVEILIDGQTPSSLGLTDIDGNPSTDTFSANSTVIQYQRNVFFFGLAPGQHIVEVKNNDSAAKDFYFNYVDVGYVSRDYTIDRKVQFNDFNAQIKGVSTAFAAEEIEMPESDGYGHSACIVGSAVGNLRVIKGLEGASSAIKAGETISFSSAVTELPLKNTTYFPSKGICIFQHPDGHNYVFSYTGKDESLIQNHKLTGIVWKKQPLYDLEVESGMENVDTLGEAKPNALVVFWADSTISINTGNNKLDFEVRIRDNTGTVITTSHTATIASGQYSGDLVPLTDAIESAMNSAKDISANNGRYLVQWDKATRRYRIGISGKDIVGINLLFATGPNVGSSIASTIGFGATDKTGSNAYYSTTAQNHIARRAYIPDAREMNSTYHPNIKWNTVALADNKFSYYDTLKRRSVGDVYVYYGNGIQGNNFPQMTIYPDKEAVGISITINAHNLKNSPYLEFSIDDGDQLYHLDPSLAKGVSGEAEHAIMQTIFLPFPRGSKKIQVASNRFNAFCRGTNNQGLIDFVAARQWFSRPLIEDIDTDTEQIIKTFDIEPTTPRYRHTFGNNAGNLFVPGGTDPVDSISENGASWLGLTNQASFNGAFRDAQSNGDYIDFAFTIPAGEVGGVGVIHFRQTDAATVNAYLSQSAIVEGTDLISQYVVAASTPEASDGHECFKLIGLPAGSYILRLKQVSTLVTRDRMYIAGWNVYTQTPSQENKYVNEEMATNGENIPHPVNVAKDTLLVNSDDRVHNTMKLTNYNWGVVNSFRYSAETNAALNTRFSIDNYTGRLHYSNKFQFTQNDYIEHFQLCKSQTVIACANDTYSTACTGFVDGRQTPNTTTLRSQCKGGLANVTYASSFAAFNKSYESSCTMAGKVVSLSDTRGIRVGQPIILVDSNGDTEKNFVESIIADVSVTVKQPLSTLTDTDVEKILFYGLHSIKFRNDDASTAYATTINYEPLPVTPSRFRRLAQAKKKLERVAEIYNVGTSGLNLAMPQFSDGNIASLNETDYYMLSYGDGSGFSMIRFPFVFQVVGGSTWVRVVGTRMVSENTRVVDWRY
jgi:hypothetical protein